MKSVSKCSSALSSGQILSGLYGGVVAPSSYVQVKETRINRLGIKTPRELASPSRIQVSSAYFRSTACQAESPLHLRTDGECLYILIEVQNA